MEPWKNETGHSPVHPATILLAVSIGVFGAVGVLSNSLLLAVILSEWRRRKPFEWLLLFLALIELAFCLLDCLFESWLTVVSGPTGLCITVGYLRCAFGSALLLVPALVAYSRYLALYDQKRYVRLFTKRRVICMCLLVWTICFCWPAPFALYGELGRDIFGICGVQPETPATVAYFSVGCALLEVVDVALFVLCFKIIRRIRKRRLNMRSKLLRETRQLVWLMLCMAVVPYVVQAPAMTICILRSFLLPLNIWVSRGAAMLFALVSPANALVTMFVMKSYRNKLLAGLSRCRMQTKSSPSSDTAPVAEQMRLLIDLARLRHQLSTQSKRHLQLCSGTQ